MLSTILSLGPLDVKYRNCNENNRRVSTKKNKKSQEKIKILKNLVAFFQVLYPSKITIQRFHGETRSSFNKTFTNSIITLRENVLYVKDFLLKKTTSLATVVQSID